MATYYVRTTGDNGNDGLSPGAAKLTIQAAVDLAAAGDTIHVGPGTYREQVTLGVSGASGNPISLLADVTGEQTGEDAGLVIITGHDSDTSAPVREFGIYTINHTWWTISGFTVSGTSGSAIRLGDGDTDNSFEGITIENCSVTNRGNGIYLYYNGGATPDVRGAIIRDCTILAFRGNHPLTIVHANNNSEHVPVNLLVENCTLVSLSTGAGVITFANASGSTNQSHSITGIIVQQCTLVGGNYGMYGSRLKDAPAITLRGCSVLAASGNTIVAIQSNNNSVRIEHSVSAGTYSGAYTDASENISNAHLGVLGGLADYPLRRVLGWSPYQPWEPILPSAAIDVLDMPDFGDTDLYGNPRPGMRGRDAGAVEARALPRQETTVVHEGSNSIHFDGAGYHDFFIPVSASEKTVSVQARVDGDYDGDPPVLRVLNIPGVADQVDAHSGAANAWEELSCAFTPGEPGVVRVRIESRDTSADGSAFFDTLDVS